MFENFIIFTEVTKLSSNVFHYLKEVNYHDKLLNLIRKKEDVATFEEIIDLVENKYLITKFISILYCCKCDEKRWIENIFKVIDYIDVSAYNNDLLIYSSAYGCQEVVKYLLERIVCDCKEDCSHGVNIFACDNRALKWSSLRGHLEIVKLLMERTDMIFRNYEDNERRNFIHYENALAYTTSKGHIEIVKYLIDKGAIY